MAIYKKVSGPDDVMTFCGEKNLWDCELYEFSQTEHATLDYELYELYEFPKRRHPLVFTTTNYTNFQNGGCHSRLRIIRIIRISKTWASPRLYDYELYEFPKRRMSLSTTNYTNYTNFQNGGCRSLYELYEFSYADTTGTNSYNSFNS